MKIIASGLLALALLASIPAPASAEKGYDKDKPFSADTFFDQLPRA